MASSATSAAMSSIPRFLLPRRGPMWQRRTLSTSSTAVLKRASRLMAPACPSSSRCTALRQARQTRLASTTPKAGSKAGSKAPKAAPKPSNILEKPAKFNPPSHGSRLPRKGRNTGPSSQHYGGDLSNAELAAQKLREYPGMMSPKGTFSHWFWTSRSLHMGITVTTLAGLAFWTFFENFRRTSPFTDMLPTREEAFSHPIQAIRTTVEVIRLTENQRSLEITEKRQRRVDDVAKRAMYRKAHGMDETVGFASSGGWFAKKEPEVPARNEVVDDQSPIAGAVPAADVQGAAVTGGTGEEAGQKKKFLGIF